MNYVCMYCRKAVRLWSDPFWKHVDRGEFATCGRLLPHEVKEAACTVS